MSGCNELLHCLQANNKEKVVPVLNYYDNVRAAQGNDGSSHAMCWEALE